MMNKYVTTFLIILVLGMTMILLIKKEAPLQFLSIPQVHAYMYTSDQETFTIPLMVSQKQSFYTNKDYISDLNITYEQQKISLLIDKIVVQPYEFKYQNSIYYPCNIVLQLAMINEGIDIKFSTASLNITYENEEKLSIYIGEFVYLFNDVTTDIAIKNMLATHSMVNNSETASGVFFELTNTSYKVILIEQLKLPTIAVSANQFYLKRVEETIKSSDKLEKILGIDYYDYYKTDIVTKKSYEVRPNESIMLYVPFAFENTIHLLYRFPIVISYLQDNEHKETTIDDFPYINTNPFQENNKDLIKIYEISD